MAGENQTLEIYQELVNRNAVPAEHRETVDELVRRGVLKGRAAPQAPQNGPRSTQEIIDYYKRGATPEQQAEIDRVYAPRRPDASWFEGSNRDGSFIGAVGDAATLGAKDEIFAGIAAPFRAASNIIRQRPADIGGEYDQQLRLNRIRRDIDANAYGSGASGVAAGVAGGALVAPGAAISAGKAVAEPFIRTVTNMLPALAVTGAKVGGAQGFAGSDGSIDPNAGLLDHASERARAVPAAALTGAAGALAFGTGLAGALKLRDVYRDRRAVSVAANQERFNDARAAGIDQPLPSVVSNNALLDRATRTSGAMIGGAPVSAAARDNIGQLSTALNRTLSAPVGGRTAGDLGIAIQDDLRNAITQRSIPSNRMRDMPSDELQTIAGRVSDEGFEPPRPRVDPIQPRQIDEIQPRDVGPEPQLRTFDAAIAGRQRALDEKLAEIRAAAEQHNQIEAARAEAAGRYPQVQQYEALSARAKELADAYNKIVDEGGMSGGFRKWHQESKTAPSRPDQSGRPMSPVDRYQIASQAELERIKKEYDAVTAQMKQLEPEAAVGREALAQYGDSNQRVERIRQLHREREQLEARFASARGLSASSRARYEADVESHSQRRQQAAAEAAEENARRRAAAEREASDATLAAQRAADDRYEEQIRQGNTGFRIGNSRESYPSEISAAYELAGREAPKGRVLPLGNGISRTATTRLLDDVAREARGSLAIRDFDGRVFDQETGGLSKPFYDYLSKHINGDMAARINELAMRRNGATAGIGPNDMRNLMRDLRRVEQAIEDSKFSAMPMTGDQALIRRLRGALMEDFTRQMRGMGDVPSFRNQDGDYRVLPGDKFTTRSQLGDDARPSDATYYVTREHLDRLMRGDVQPDGRMSSLPATVSLVNEGNQIGLRNNRTGRFDRARLVPFSRQPEPGMVPIQVWDEGHRLVVGAPVISRPPRQGERAASMFQNADRQQAQFYEEIRRPLHKIFGDKVDPVQAMDRLVKAAETGETQLLGAYMRVMTEKSDPRKGFAAIIHHATGGGTDIARFGEFWRGLNPASRRVMTASTPNQALARELDNFARMGQRLERYTAASKRSAVDVASLGHVPTTTAIAVAAGWQAAVGVVAANALGARVLTSPRLTRWLTQAPNAMRGGFESPAFARHMARLGAMAASGAEDERETARRLHAAFKSRIMN